MAFYRSSQKEDLTGRLAPKGKSAKWAHPPWNCSVMKAPVPCPPAYDSSVPRSREYPLTIPPTSSVGDLQGQVDGSACGA